MSLSFYTVVIRCNDKAHVFSDDFYEELNTYRGYLHRGEEVRHFSELRTCLFAPVIHGSRDYMLGRLG